MSTHSDLQRLARLPEQLLAMKVSTMEQQQAQQQLNQHGALAEQHMGNREYREAVDHYTQVLILAETAGISPQVTAQVYSMRGECLQKMDRLRKALFDFNQALLLDPMIKRYYYIRGSIQSRQANSIEAIKDFTMVQELNQEQPLNSIALAFEKGQWEDVFSKSALLLTNPQITPTEKIALYTKRGIAFLALNRYKEAACAFEAAIACVVQQEPENTQVLMDLHFLNYLVFCELRNSGGSPSFPLSTSTFDLEDGSSYYQYLPTEQDGASILHALLGTPHQGRYFCPQVRTLFIEKLKAHFAQNTQGVTHAIGQCLKNHIEALYNSYAPNHPEAFLVLGMGMFSKIHKMVEGFQQKTQTLEKEKMVLFQAISKLRGRVITEIIHLCDVDPDNCDTVLKNMSDKELNDLFTPHEEELLELLDPKTELYAKLKQNQAARCENDEKQRNLVLSPEILQRYYTACESPDYRFSIPELQMAALLFDKPCRLLSANEVFESSLGVTPFVMIKKGETGYYRYDLCSEHTYQRLAGDVLKALRLYDKEKMVFSDQFFSLDNQTQAEFYCAQIKIAYTPTAANQWERYGALITLARHHEEGNLGLVKNVKKAAQFYDKAAQLALSQYGTPQAAFEGYMAMLQKEGAPSDKALVHYELGELYKTHNNLGQAQVHYMQSAQLKHVKANKRLARLYQEGLIHVDPSRWGLAVREDLMQAHHHLKQALEKNPLSKTIHHEMGSLYYQGLPEGEEGEKTRSMYEKAHEHFTQAIRQGHAKSFLWQAWMFAYGQGMSQVNLKKGEECAMVASRIPATRNSAQLCLKLIHSLMQKKMDEIFASYVQKKILAPHLAANTQGDLVLTFRDRKVDSIHYQLGKIDAWGQITWKNHYCFETAIQGEVPVAMYNRDVVFVRSDNKMRQYRLARIEETNLRNVTDWVPIQSFNSGASGIHSSIAMNENLVIEVHRSEVIETMHCVIGRINAQRTAIDWLTNWSYDKISNFRGLSDSTVAIQDNLVVTVVNQTEGQGLTCIVGEILPNRTWNAGKLTHIVESVTSDFTPNEFVATWGEPLFDGSLNNHCNPKITFIARDRLLLVTEDRNSGNIYSRVLRVDRDAKKILFTESSFQYNGIGKQPCVAYTQGQTVAFYESNLFNGSHLCRTHVV